MTPQERFAAAVARAEQRKTVAPPAKPVKHHGLRQRIIDFIRALGGSI